MKRRENGSCRWWFKKRVSSRKKKSTRSAQLLEREENALNGWKRKESVVWAEVVGREKAFDGGKKIVVWGQKEKKQADFFFLLLPLARSRTL